MSRKNNFGMLRVLPPHPLGVCQYALGVSVTARLAYLVLFPRQVAKRSFTTQSRRSRGYHPPQAVYHQGRTRPWISSIPQELHPFPCPSAGRVAGGASPSPTDKTHPSSAPLTPPSVAFHLRGAQISHRRYFTNSTGIYFTV